MNTLELMLKNVAEKKAHTFDKLKSYYGDKELVSGPKIPIPTAPSINPTINMHFTLQA